MRNVSLNEGERIDSLVDDKLQIIQSTDVFSYGMDAVLLARFPRLPRKGHIVDFCAGNGAVGLLMSTETEAKITGIEIQARLADMAQRSVMLNHLENQISVIQDDLKNVLEVMSPSSVDLITCNPPYFPVDEESRVNENLAFMLARHELATTIDEIIDSSRKILKSNGHLALVHRPARFFEVMDKLRASGFAPKHIQFVYPKADAAANLLLIDAIKDGHSGGEIFLPPLIVYATDGTYTKAIQEIYKKNSI